VLPAAEAGYGAGPRPHILRPQPQLVPKAGPGAEVGGPEVWVPVFEARRLGDLAEGLQPQPPVGAPERRVEAALQAGAGLEGGGLPAGPRRVLGGRELHLGILLFYYFL